MSTLHAATTAAIARNRGLAQRTAAELTTLASEMRKRGISVRFQTTVSRIERRDAGVRVTLSDGAVVDADAIMFATGRARDLTPLRRIRLRR
jgi:pyruvate/2-oxoglutarate dehydrogenase complex dihydrolipoamide dehydrogenase (E3) component